MLWAVVVGLMWLRAAGTALEPEWNCPEIDQACSCDIPHTLRCSGTSPLLLAQVTSALSKRPPAFVSLLDLSIQNLDSINSPILQNISLHGLVISSGGTLKWISPDAFKGLSQPFEALGLPNNLLKSVPNAALEPLKTLTRLDISNNTIVSLDSSSFKGLSQLQVLDLRGNGLKAITPLTFLQVPFLRILHLQMNFLTTSEISQLHGLLNLEELDLSRNYITGPLNASTLPRLPRLRNLNLGNNQMSSVTKGALSGLDSLETLSLENNMIDVLEDHAFLHLSSLVSLDLSHNRVVAVSEASLEHLTRLRILDISHNFLRAVTPDLVYPLRSLEELKLDDNDISMIADKSLDSAGRLKSITLSENPLNCDCNIAYFNQWMKNSSMDIKMKKLAVCTTPPSLENGLVLELTADQLLCSSGDDNLDSPGSEGTIPVSGSRVTLQGFSYNGETAYLLWKIETTAIYHCDSLFVYEELGTHEILLEHNRLHCNSSDLSDPTTLPVSMEAQHLQKGHKYRYCLVMVEKTATDSALILGCSEILPLVENKAPQILSLRANQTSPNSLTISATIWPQNYLCHVTYYVSANLKSYKQTKVDCSSPIVSLKILPHEEGPYKICAVIPNVSPYCINTSPNHENYYFDKSPSVIMSLIFLLIFLVIVFILYRWLKNVFSRPKLHEQCFLASSHAEQQHSRYVKLQATTKV